jgi:hypothetical protein
MPSGQEWPRERLIRLPEFPMNAPSPVVRNALGAAATTGYRIVSRFAVALLVLGPLAQHAAAAERRAASASRENVGKALAACLTGDTLVIPEGTVTWTQTLNVTKAITIKGAGIGKTILLDNIDRATGDAALPSNGREAVIFWASPNDGACRLTGIEIRHGGRTTQYFGGAVQLSGTTNKFRVDNCFFNNLNNRAIQVWAAAWGVIDHCRFDTEVFGRQAISFFMYSQYGGSNGVGAWSNPVGWGTNEAMFVEDCQFNAGANSSGATDGYSGAKFVFRYNIVRNSHVGNHGTESTAHHRGTRLMEVYNNRFIRTEPAQKHAAIDFRSGTGQVHNNTFEGNYGYIIKLGNYRNFLAFNPWGGSDGTMAWDGNDLSDGAATPGGAGDGVFEAGTATGGAENALIDARKSWIPDQWKGYTLRQIVRGQATSGGLRTLTVSPSPGWVAGQWNGWQITKVADNTKAIIAIATADTITTAMEGAPIDFTGGGAFVLSRASEIVGNSDTTIRNMGQGTYIPNYVYKAGDAYEIRQVDWALDQPGRGVSDTLIPAGTAKFHHQNLNQQADPIYQWNNTHNGQPVKIGAAVATIKSNRDYFDNTPMPGYKPYTYPHPLVTGGPLKPSVGKVGGVGADNAPPTE